MGSAQRRRDLRHLVRRNHSMMALVAALTRHDTRGKVQRLLDTTLGNKPDDFFNTLLASTFQASLSYRWPLRGRRGRLSLLSLICSVRAPVAYSIGDLGGFPRKDFTARSIFQLEISRWSLLAFLFILLALRADVLSRIECDGSSFFFFFSSPPLLPAIGT